MTAISSDPKQWTIGLVGYGEVGRILDAIEKKAIPERKSITRSADRTRQLRRDALMPSFRQVNAVALYHP
jgi:hypothetical protein